MLLYGLPFTVEDLNQYQANLSFTYPPKSIKNLKFSVLKGYNKRKIGLRKIGQLFHNGGPYHIETSPLICCANKWTGLYMIGTTVMKELILAVTS